LADIHGEHDVAEFNVAEEGYVGAPRVALGLLAPGRV
jgi:hypothetical protein